MAKRRNEAQLDLFAQDLAPAQPALPGPVAAETTQLSKLLAAAAPPAPPVVEAVDGLRKARISRRSASDIAERAAETWHRQRAVAGDGIAIPMGIVAGLMLLRKTGRDGTDVASFILGLDKQSLLEFHRRIWAHLWIRHPYLVDCARGIHEWLNEAKDPPAKVVDAIHAVTHEVIRSGLLELTGDPEPVFRCEADVLGLLLTQMRSQGASSALAEIHTPADVADLMAGILMLRGSTSPGQWFDEPAAGTGGMFRAAALAMRMRGLNPGQFGWSMSELDPIAAACAAVNALVWDLGPNVLVWCGDTLAVGDGPVRAWERRKSVLEHHDRMMSIASMAAAVKQTQILLGMVKRGAA
jgi:hypothetical protein